MKRLILVIITLSVFSINIYSQSDYKSYYKYVYRAENHLMDKKYDSAAVEYKKAFEQVDYIFVKDLINTTYLSLILKNDSMFVASLTKAFCEGLEITDPMIVKNKKIQKLNKSLGNILEAKYDSCRNVYTNTYNLELREKLLEMDKLDQSCRKKNIFGKYNLKKRNIGDSLNRVDLLAIIDKYGFPGPLLIGYTDTHPLFTPTGIIIHHLGNEKIPDSILINAIYTGNYQPDAYGMMYDYHNTNYTLEIPDDKRILIKAYYCMNLKKVDNDSLRKMVNNYRKEILMPTVQFSKKTQYYVKHRDEYFYIY